MERRTFLKYGSAMSMATLLGNLKKTNAAAVTNKPNILFFFIDDMGCLLEIRPLPVTNHCDLILSQPIDF